MIKIDKKDLQNLFIASAYLSGACDSYYDEHNDDNTCDMDKISSANNIIQDFIYKILEFNNYSDMCEKLAYLGICCNDDEILNKMPIERKNK